MSSLKFPSLQKPPERSLNAPLLQLQHFLHTNRFFRNRASAASDRQVSYSAVRGDRHSSQDGQIRFKLSQTSRESNVKFYGNLSRSDQLRSASSDSYMDQYQLSGLKPGKQVHIQLRSSSFDAYLELVNTRTNRSITRNDDRADRSTNSSLTFTVKSGISYAIRVTSASPDSTGKYHLSADCFPASIGKFNFSYGYGLVDAAAAVARAVGQKPFKQVRDLGGNDWGLDLVKAPEAWAKGFTGKGITVAVLDTGVDVEHPDLSTNIWNNEDEIPNNGRDDDRNGFVDDVHGWSFADRDSNDVSDIYRHGTHVSGTIAAVKNRFGVTGVAHAAKVMPVRVIGSSEDNSLRKFDANLSAGIRYAVNNGARVISMSLGNYPGDPSMFQTKFALKYARRSGVVVVMASGNERESYGATQPIYPALFGLKDLGIGVGAIDSQRRVANFSTPAGRKPLPFLVAPGVTVRSTVPGGSYEKQYWSGTSMATPHVAGVVALMLSANPRLTPARVERILTATATSKGITIP